MRMLRLMTVVLAIPLLAGRLAPADAQSGVGISHSEIVIEEKLKEGGRYRLPSVAVSNTGSEAARYEVVISYIQDQEEHAPETGWFRFEPQAFDLAPGESQPVSITLNVGSDADSGEYFALIEAHPVQIDSGIAVGVAAATKLSFEVKPSSFFELWRLRIAHFFEDNSPFSVVLPPLVAGLILIYFVSRRFRLRIERRR